MYKIINKKKLFATMVADLFGNLIYFPSSLLKKRSKIRVEEINEILVIRTAYIGDVVMTLPMLKPLRGKFPSARITFLTSERAKCVLINNPYIDNIVTYDPFWFYPSSKKEYFIFLKKLKKIPFDLVIESRGDLRELFFLVRPLKVRFKVGYDVGGGGYLYSHIVPYKGVGHKVEYHLDIARFLGCKTVDEIEWGIYLSEEEGKRVVSIIEAEGINEDDNIVVIHPGSRKELKCWSPEGYAAVADALIDEFSVSVLLTGAPDEVALVEKVECMMKNKAVVLAGKLTIRELAGVIRLSSLIICNDSAPMHIGAAMKTSTVAIFGPSKSIETGPYGDKHVVIEKDFPCRYTCDEDVCLFKNYNQCMRDISADDVISKAKKIISPQ